MDNHVSSEFGTFGEACLAAFYLALVDAPIVNLHMGNQSSLVLADLKAQVAGPVHLLWENVDWSLDNNNRSKFENKEEKKL